jgi:formylglycine-generating enzyme required for sulfatase activity
MSLQTGQILNNRYRIFSLLGQGGFGAVYRAWDLNMDRPRALKENLDISPEAQRQFKRESQILDIISHPNLPKVIDHFVVPGQGQYLVMEYIEGEDLQDKLDKRGSPFPENKVIPWIEQICDAVQYLHNQVPPIIHRDIKPANIKITPQGRAVLVDFGIAKVYDPILKTTVGARAVTPGYSPPEQYGQGRTDTRADIYALGSTLYTLLTGIASPDSVDIMTGRQPPPTPVSSLNPSVSPYINTAITRAMHLVDKQRFQTVSELKASLSAKPPEISSIPIATQAVTSSISAHQYPKPKSQSIPKWLIWTAGLFILVLVIIIGFQSIQSPVEEAVITIIAQGTKPLPTSQLSETPEPSIAAPSSTNEPQPVIITTQISPLDGMVLVYVPEGEFEMGSEFGNDNEKPVHMVYQQAFWLDQTVITNALYQHCVEVGECSLPSDTDYYFDEFYWEHPVVYVSWDDAQTYCRWADRRLPTEAEWEKAARGAMVGKIYPWGNESPVCTPGALYGAQSSRCGEGTVPVKTFGFNSFGLYDLAGNVWEWVADWYDVYPNGVPDSDLNFGEKYRVIRGGSFYDDLSDIRTGLRDWGNPVDRVDNIGFRCALDASP